MVLNFTAYWLVGFPIAYWLGIRAGHGRAASGLGLIVGMFACTVLLSALRRCLPAPCAAPVAVWGGSELA
jgi:hypothetical protein